jgi:hypothetical protein
MHNREWRVRLMNNSNILFGISNLSIAALMILLSIPLLRGDVKMNWIYGARFKKSFVSDENWYKINRYAAKQVIGWSIPLFLAGIAALFVDFGANDNIRTGLVIVFASAPAIILIPAVISYLYAQRL